MSSIKVQLNKYRESADGTYMLIFQIIHCRKRRVISSPYYIKEEYFDLVKERVISKAGLSTMAANKINEYIQETVRILRHVISLLEGQSDEYSVSDILERYRLVNSEVYLLTYMRNHVASLLKENRKGTASAYQSTYNRVLNFIDANEKFTFADINVKWINAFISELNGENLKKNSINLYIRLLRAIYNKAYKEGIMGTQSFSPFRNVVLGSVKTVKRAVCEDIIRKIVKADLSAMPHLEMSRDLFLFSFYARGMSFVDLAYLKNSDIINNTIYYNRSKTKQPFQVEVVFPLQQIINKYKSDRIYLFPILQKKEGELYTQYRNGIRYYNNDLKLLSTYLNLPVPLTSYVSRHSWATLARNKGVSVAIISEALGHHSEKTTYTYLASLDLSMINNANNLIANLFV